MKPCPHCGGTTEVNGLHFCDDLWTAKAPPTSTSGAPRLIAIVFAGVLMAALVSSQAAAKPPCSDPPCKPRTTPRPSPTQTATPVPTTAPSSLRWGLIGNSGTHNTEERQAGITAKVVELAWSQYEPTDDGWSGTYLTSKRSELASLHAAGFAVILSFGVQYPPAWLLALPNSRYVNQYGVAYDDTAPGSGRANTVWNPVLRAQMGAYLAKVLADLSPDAVRIGGGRYGELGYPVASYGGRTNTYWAFDAEAVKSDPVPGWVPGQSSPNGQARAFLDWYLSKLVEYETWQLGVVRAAFAGPVMVLFPSFGIRPGQADAAIAVNLNGSTSAEINGEVQRGYDYASQVTPLSGNVLVTTTWLDCPFGDDAAADPGKGSPVKYLASLGKPMYGENTGHGDAAHMAFTDSQASKYGLTGFAWFNETELFSGQYATLADYAAVIQ